MAFPLHYLLQYGGDFVSDPTEIWSNTIRFAPDLEGGGGVPPGLTNAQQTTVAAGMLGVLQTFMANTASKYSSNVRLKYAKFNRIGTDGLYLDKSTTNAAFVAAAGTPGVGNSPYPITVAMVVTWRTRAERGRASRGRIFVPQPSQAIDPGSLYRFPPSALTSITAAYRSMLISLNGVMTSAAAGSGAASVVSGLPENGLALPITRVEVGDIPDYMGSRRNNLKETRTQSAPLV